MGLVNLVEVFPPNLRPDSRAKDATTSVGKKLQAFKEEVAEGTIPYFAAMTRLAFFDIGTNSTQVFDGSQCSLTAMAWLLEKYPHAWPSQVWEPFHPVTADRCVLFGINIRNGLKIFCANARDLGHRSIPCRLWRANELAFDPFDECVSHDLRHTKISYNRILAGMDCPPSYEPNVNAGVDMSVAVQLVKSFGLA